MRAVGRLPVRDRLADCATLAPGYFNRDARPMAIADAVSFRSAGPGPTSRLVVGVLAEKRQEIGCVPVDPFTALSKVR